MNTIQQLRISIGECRTFIQIIGSKDSLYQYIRSLKSICLFLLLFAAPNVYSQSDMELLSGVLKKIEKRKIDTVIIFGQHCIDCYKENTSRFILCFSEKNKIYNRLIVYKSTDFRPRKIVDSLYVGDENCSIIIGYVKERFLLVKKQLNEGDVTEGYRDSNGVLRWDVMPFSGHSIVCGFHIKGKTTTRDLFLRDNANKHYKNSNELWTFYSLLWMQWGRLLDSISG